MPRPGPPWCSGGPVGVGRVRVVRPGATTPTRKRTRTGLGTTGVRPPVVCALPVVRRHLTARGAGASDTVTTTPLGVRLTGARSPENRRVGRGVPCRARSHPPRRGYGLQPAPRLRVASDRAPERSRTPGVLVGRRRPADVLWRIPARPAFRRTHRSASSPPRASTPCPITRRGRSRCDEERDPDSNPVSRVPGMEHSSSDSPVPSTNPASGARDRRVVATRLTAETVLR